MIGKSLPPAFLLLLLCCALTMALGGRDAPRGEDPGTREEMVTVRGRVRITGNEPFTELVIAGEEDEWYVEDPGDRKLLEGYQRRIVTVRGLAGFRELILANGQKIGGRKTLRHIIVSDVSGD
ncbi:MAG: hypothetical protein LBP32_07750 [Spirochaetaceae bacterium]|jgi:hypothetical protein|nr:hypothetical protein [Spirochaetaceae bacterium]